MSKTFVNVVGIQYSLITDGPKTHFGQADHSKATIYLNPTSAHTQQGDTLLHEVLHSISSALNLNLTEKTVARLAVGLHQTLTANPKLFHRVVSGKRIV
jgi:hypothetical protein